MESTDARAPAQQVSDESSAAIPPYELEVLKEEFDGEHLMLLASVKAHKAVKENDPLVRVTPYQQGNPLPTSTFRVLDYLSNTGESRSGAPVKMPLVVPADGMTDYQIELLWGKEAQAALAEQRRLHAAQQASSEISGLHVSDVRMLEGGTLYARLHNNSEKVLNELGLEVAFAKSGEGLDFQKAFQDNGVLVELRGLNLVPNGEKKLKIVLDNSFPSDARYSPLIRVIPLPGEAIEIYE